MNSKNPIDSLLQELDGVIQKREKSLSIIDNDYVDEDGKVLSRDYTNYQRRRETVLRRFENEALGVQYKIDDLCKEIREKQPELENLTAASIRRDRRFPNILAIDKIKVNYLDLEFCVPRLVAFPFSRNIALPSNDASDQLLRLILRMLYALPCGKISLHIFDPLNLGDSVRSLKVLLAEDKIFPEKKVLSGKKEVRECLERALEYSENLIQNIFPAGCNSYAQYNQIQRKKKDYKNALPYHVYLFFDAPQNLDEPCMEMLSTLAGLSERCGHLVILTYDGIALEEESEHHTTFDKSVLILKKIIEKSAGLEFFAGLHLPTLKYLKTSYAFEHLPDEMDLLERMNDLRTVYEEIASSGTSFEDLNEGWSLFDRTSERCLAIPIGFSDTSNAKLEMLLDDATPHYLVGGTTGSGKSNFLHILILSMCSRYSPEELELYLLDFKDGVEFAAYANPELPHARLVAMEADTEYGVSVLNYLISEKERRNREFKQKGVKDIAGYRAGNFGKMPRIVLIVDEFQVLFSSEDKENTIAGLNMLAKQGRACGIHLVMATQSLADVNFSDTQFGGRIALRCSAEDSKLLMGGILTNNEAAADLTIPFAILNTENGRVSGNRKFSVPRAEEIINQTVRDLVTESENIGFRGKTDLFFGQLLPNHPDTKAFYCADEVSLRLGENLEYPSHQFSVTLEQKGGANLIICGSEDVYRKGLIRSVLLSGAGCEKIQKIICIGNIEKLNGLTLYKKILYFNTTHDWIENEDTESISSGTLVMLDGVNLKNEIGFDPIYLDPDNTQAKYFKKFLSESGKNNCHIVAFYDRFTELEDSGLDIDHFIHKIGFGMSNNDISRFTGDFTGVSGRQSSRAFYSCAGKFQGHFKPYGEMKHD